MDKIINKEIKVNFKNYTNVKNGEYTLENSYLYLIKGPNDIGKTHFITAIMSLLSAKQLVPDPITTGKKETVVRGSIPGPSGNYTIEMRITPKITTFIMYTPDNILVKNKTEIRNVFKYNIPSVEEFIRKSYTPEGRREQIKIILNLLPEELKNKYIENLNLLDQRKGLLWNNRKEKSNELQKATIKKELLALNDKEISLLKNEKYIEEKYNKLKSQHELIENYDKLNDDLIKIKELVNTEKQNALEIIKIKEERLLAIEKEKENIENFINQRKKETNEYIIDKNKEIKLLSDNINNIDVKNKDSILEEYNNIKIEKTTLSKIINKKIEIEEFDKKYNLIKEASDKAFKAIDDVREQNKMILEKSDLSEFNIKIEDNKIYIGDYVFDENQVADSKLTLVTANILAKTLTKSQILIVGKLAELDNKSKNELFKIGKENNLAIIGDDVDDNYEDIFVKGYIEEGISESIIKKVIQNNEKDNLLEKTKESIKKEKPDSNEFKLI